MPVRTKVILTACYVMLFIWILSMIFGLCLFILVGPAEAGNQIARVKNPGEVQDIRDRYPDHRIILVMEGGDGKYNLFYEPDQAQYVSPGNIDDDCFYIVMPWVKLVPSYQPTRELFMKIEDSSQWPQEVKVE